MKNKNAPLTVEQCRKGYWDACSLYQAVKNDPFATYTQLGEAAQSIDRWRKDWVKAVQRQRQRRDPQDTNVVRAIEDVCAETGEDVVWVAHRFNKRIGA